MTVDPKKKYTATLHTSKGDIVIQLFPDKAPVTVNSFIFLARNGWFNNVIFHRVIPGFVAQTGDPSGSGFGTPGYAFDNEISPNLKFDKAGVVGMANAGPGSNGSQFFITYGPAPSLNGGYTIFGQVTAGMDVAQKLTPRDPSSGGDLPAGDVIQSVTIEEK
ncbi:MAG: peptidylprolyl isomerase [Omnitrophica WOR_2 bacterium]